MAARVTKITRRRDFGAVARLLRRRRDEILERWLAAAAAQPFHQGRRDRAVADHIPALFDALVALLEREAPRDVDASPPLDDPDALTHARSHARMRVRQGLEAADILMEFRLLRQEIGRALHLHLRDSAPTRDVVAAELLLHDALDGAIFLAIAALGEHDTEQEAEHARRMEERRVLDEEREGFVLAIAHDLKNPLTAIKGSAQILQRQAARGGIPPERLEAKLALMDEAATRATDRLNELVEAVRSRDDQVLQLRREAVDLVDVSERVVAIHQHGTEAHRIVLVAQEPEVVGEWDAARIERVVDNLVSNAVKYSPAGGTVTVEVARDRERGEAVLSVRDWGLGIPAKDLPHIFERFRRAANVERIGGTGIGLAAALHIVARHGGTIAVESTEGEGSTFLVRLPLHPPAVENGAYERAATANETKKPRQTGRARGRRDGGTLRHAAARRRRARDRRRVAPRPDTG